MTVEAIEKQLKEGKLSEIYLFYGEEAYLIEACVKKIKKLFGEIVKGINYVEIDDTKIELLISELQTPSFGYPKKLIVVKNTGLFKREVKKKGANFQEIRDKICEYLNQNKEIIKQDYLLVFMEETVDKGRMLSCLEEIGASICQIEYQKLPNIVARLKAVCKAYEVIIEDSTLKYFIESVRNQFADLNE